MANLDNYFATLSNLEDYVSESSYNCKSRLFGERSGFMAETISYGRTYYIKFIVHPKSETVMIEISPGITCAPYYERAFDAYVAPVNDECIPFKFQRSDTGRIYLYYCHRITGGPITAEEIDEIGTEMLVHLMCHLENLERVTHGDPPQKPGSLKSVKETIRRLNREGRRRTELWRSDGEEEDEEEETEEEEEERAAGPWRASAGGEPDLSVRERDMDRLKQFLSRLAAAREEKASDEETPAAPDHNGPDNSPSPFFFGEGPDKGGKSDAKEDSAWSGRNLPDGEKTGPAD